MALSNIKKGSGNIAGLYVGDTEVSKAYLGTTLVYEKGSPGPHDYTRDYLTFEILTSGTIIWKTSAYNVVTPADYYKTISYRVVNGDNIWVSITSSMQGASISVTAGDVVEFKGTNSAYYYVFGSGAYSGAAYTGFQAGTASYNIQGNIMSMLGGDNFYSLTSITEQAALAGLFARDDYSYGAGPISAENLKLPATSISQLCYYSLFGECVALTTAPEMSSAVAAYSHSCMFIDCFSLTTVPALSLASMSGMDGVCMSMFENCYSLTSLTVTTDTLQLGDINNILVGASPSGTLYCSPNAESVWIDAWGNNMIPSGWTITTINNS